MHAKKPRIASTQPKSLEVGVGTVGDNAVQTWCWSLASALQHMLHVVLQIVLRIH